MSIKSKRRILLSNSCTNCGKVPTHAIKMSDFWVEYCDECKGQPAKLDAKTLLRTGRYVAVGSIVQ